MKDLVAKAEGIENLHVYESSASSSTSQVVQDLHTDAGLLIAMTFGSTDSYSLQVSPPGIRHSDRGESMQWGGSIHYSAHGHRAPVLSGATSKGVLPDSENIEEPKDPDGDSVPDLPNGGEDDATTDIKSCRSQKEGSEVEGATEGVTDPSVPEGARWATKPESAARNFQDGPVSHDAKGLEDP